MTTTSVPLPPLSIELSAQDRHTILENVLAALRKRFYAPEKLNAEWQAAVDRHRPSIESAGRADQFEQAVSDLLSELRTSHVGFFHGSARRASSRAALSATYLDDETPYGKRWIFQDVHSGGAAANAGIEPGNILIAVDGREIVPPEHPVFPMGKQTKVEFVDNQEKRQSVMVDVARPKGKKLHFVEPTLVEARMIGRWAGLPEDCDVPWHDRGSRCESDQHCLRAAWKCQTIGDRSPGEYWRRDRCASRHELAHAGQNSGWFRPRSAACECEPRPREAKVPALLADSIKYQSTLAIGSAICPGNARKKACGTRDRRSGRTAVPRACRSARRSTHSECSGNDRRVRAREQIGDDHW